MLQSVVDDADVVDDACQRWWRKLQNVVDDADVVDAERFVGHASAAVVE